MDSNPIKYSDLIKDDGAIDKAIRDLEELEASYKEVTDTVKSGAKGMADELKKTSSVTDEGRKKTEKMSYEARKLKAAYQELKLAMSETGAKIQDLKVQTNALNTSNRDAAQYNRAIANSYAQLKAELKILVAEYKNSVSAQGLTSEAAKGLLDKIIALKAELKKHDDAMRIHIERVKQQKAQLTAEEKARQKLKAAMSQNTVEIAKLNRQTQEAIRVAKLKAVIDTEQEGSYNRLSAQYALNKIELNKMSQAERETTETGKKLVQETYNIYQSMIKMQEATGKHTLSVGNYKKHWDGLGVAINQVMREVPAAAISINTFFLGISNNIPMLIDEIQRLRTQNRLLAAEGKQQINVTKQIIKSIFSWNTALIALLTILAMHGDAIIDWIAGLFKGKSAVASLTEQIEAINAELENGAGSYSQNITEYKKLKNEWSDLTSLKEREEWLKKNEDAFRQLDIACRDVNDADRLFVDQTSEVLEAFKNRAKAAAAMELAQKKYQEAFVQQEKARLEAMKGPSFGDKIKNAFVQSALRGGIDGNNVVVANVEVANRVSDESFHADRVKDMEAEAKVAEETADSYFKLAEGYQAAADAVLGNYEKPEKTKKPKKGRQPKDPTDFLDRTSTDVQKKYLESITKLEQDELAKRRKETMETYNSEVAALNDRYNKVTRILKNENNEYKKLTDEQKIQALAAQETIVKTIELKQQQLSQDLANIERDRQIQELQILQQTLDLRLQAVKAGSEEELRLRLQSAEAQRRISILQNAKLPESQQVSEADISAGFTKSAALTKGSYEMNTFDEQQDLQEAQYEAVWHNELSLTKFKLEQEKERWQKQIQLAKEGGLDWSETQIETAEATVKGIDRELSELNSIVGRIAEKGLVGGILEHLGFDDKQIDAVNTVTDQVIASLQEIAQAEVEAAQAAVEAAQERVDAAKSALDAEIEARNNGYANNVEAARKELEQEKKNQADKERMLEEAQKRQERLNTIAQASNLVTASAGIWASFAPLGPLGIGLALAGIATMWGSFMAAKIKANQLTQETQEYGDGGLEFLEGGSHASGNDIDLGVNNNRNKRMKAEGGEALAIINKKQTTKYKRVLPDVIDSLNKGIFEDKYVKVNAIGADTNIIVSGNSTPDLTKIEDTLIQIKNQGDATSQVLPDGTIIETKRNARRIIKR